MTRLLRILFIVLIVWPVMWIWLGIRIKNRHHLPKHGPAIIVANHNSHMDVFALLSLFPLKQQWCIHPVAAADYFLNKKWLAWFTLHILNIIPVIRGGHQANPLAKCEEALAQNQILILFPEGTRGEPGKLAPLKSGIWYLSQKLPEVPIIPVWLTGTERIMAKGNRIPLPLFIDANIGEAIYYHPDKEYFKNQLLQKLLTLEAQTINYKWNNSK